MKLTKFITTSITSSLTILARAVMLVVLASKVLAVDLNTVYNDALVNDPTFKAAEAEWLANRELLPQYTARLLPQIGFSGSLGRARSSNSQSASHSIVDTGGYKFEVTQAIFDFERMGSVWQAQAEQGAYYARYLYAGQNLFFRVIKSYFETLLAQDNLHYAKIHKASSSQVYIRAVHKFKEGLINVTDLEEAKRDYELATAEEIKARNDLECAFESLAVITGVHYSRLDGLKDDLRLETPEPEDANAWVEQAKQHNLSLIAANFTSQAAKQAIKVSSASHLPSLYAKGDYQFNNQSQDAGGLHASAHSKELAGALVLNMPIFSGGGASAKVSNAKYNYQKSIAELEQAYRTAVSSTLQSYLSVISGIKQVEAQKQAVVSSKSALRATYISYIVGSRTMSDVSEAQTKLNYVQTGYSRARYEYITNWAALKVCVGGLSEADIDAINGWLSSELKQSAEEEGLENLFGKDSQELLLPDLEYKS